MIEDAKTASDPLATPPHDQLVSGAQQTLATGDHAESVFPMGEVTPDSIERFRRSVFGSVRRRDELSESLHHSTMSRLERGMLLWALGRFAEASPILEAEVDRHPALGL